MENGIKLSELLNKFRNIVEKSQKEIADELNLPAPSLSFYENDERLPPYEALVELLDFYDAKLKIEADLGEWTFHQTDDGELKLEEEEKTEEIGLLKGIDKKEKEDLIAYIRRRRRNSS